MSAAPNSAEPNRNEKNSATPPPRGKSKVWFWLLLLLIVVAGLGYFLTKKPGVVPVTYKTILVERGNLRVTILSTGNVLPENRLEIKPPIAGRIEKILIQEGDIVHKGQILGWMSSTERAGLLDAARAKGPEEVARWEELYQPTPIMAPIAGTIILKNVEAGQTFANTDVVMAMSDRLLIKASVDETDIAQIHLDQRADVLLDAYPTMKIPAKVERISFEAKTVSNVTTYTVDVLADDVPDAMRSGMTANITFISQAKNNVLFIPTSALRGSGTENSVLIPDPQTGKPVEHSVRTGITDGKRTEIVAGLKQGEQVLVANFKATPASATVTNPFAPMPPKSNSKNAGGAPPPHP